LINGLGAFGSSITTLAANAAQDAATTPARAPLLNTPAAAPPESTPAGPAPAGAAAPALAGQAAAASGGSATVPPDLLPIYQATSKRTGIPIDVLLAQAKQESGFDPTIVSKTGGIGLHQIQAATARDPGYGLRGIDPATLTDPATNINFAADYMKAKAGNPNFADPRSVDAAVAAYNGGGDPNYVQNVRRHMGAA
jgi:soluble lytic murein transglycosylase-like protein